MKAHLQICFCCLALVAMVLPISCKKSVIAVDNPYGLPNATQRGAGMFAFRMNGSNYFAKNDLYNLGASVNNDTVSVRAFFDYGHYFGGFYIGTAANAKLNTAYDLSDTIHTYCLFVTDSTCQQVVRTTNIKSKSGQIMLTRVDSSQKIISGIFNVKVIVANCDSLVVTSGRFDCKYQ